MGRPRRLGLTNGALCPLQIQLTLMVQPSSARAAVPRVCGGAGAQHPSGRDASMGGGAGEYTPHRSADPAAGASNGSMMLPGI